MTFPGGTGRWEVRTGHFRQGGIPLELLVMTDVSQSLRDEERQAWQRLIRVIGHEINNSLAPDQVDRAQPRTDPRPASPSRRTGRATCAAGCRWSASRADSLGRFTAAYAQLARLPAPTLAPVELAHSGGPRRRDSSVASP